MDGEIRVSAADSALPDFNFGTDEAGGSVLSRAAASGQAALDAGATPLSAGPRQPSQMNRSDDLAYSGTESTPLIIGLGTARPGIRHEIDYD